jgi:hypothetical protein
LCLKKTFIVLIHINMMKFVNVLVNGLLKILPKLPKMSSPI